MALKYNVLVRAVLPNVGTKVLANFDTRQIFTLANASIQRPGTTVASEYVVGQLFQVIRAKKELSIIFDSGATEAVHGFLDAKTNRRMLALAISLLRDGTRLETLLLNGVRVQGFGPVENNAYAAHLSLAGGLVQDFDDKGVVCHVTLWQQDGNGQGSGPSSGNWSATRTRLVGFGTDQISVPPHPPTREPLRNEVVVGRVFQAIEARKELSIVVGGGPAPEHRDATRLFLEAQRDRTSYDIQIELFRGTSTKVLDRVDYEGEWPYLVPKPVWHDHEEYDSLARIRLGKVQVKDYLPIEGPAYAAHLKVTGGTHAEDIPPK
jgi:hypothetical protein